MAIHGLDPFGIGTYNISKDWDGKVPLSHMGTGCSRDFH